MGEDGRLLSGKVCVVTGASRGAGLAIATELGRAGATVYVTGRSTRAAGRTDGMPGTVEDASELVASAGGVGIGVRVDHTDDRAVHALFARVRDEQGHLDLLVNNAWGGYEQHDPAAFVAPFWEQPTGRWDAMFTAGLRATLMASREAVPLMLATRSGLVVNTVAWSDGEYLGNLFYDVAKAAIVRATFGMALELRDHGVSVVALAPGFMRTERVMAAHASQPFPLDATESPAYLGRAVVALLTHPGIYDRSGKVLDVGALAHELGFTDVDGAQPAPFRVGAPRPS